MMFAAVLVQAKAAWTWVRANLVWFLLCLVILAGGLWRHAVGQVKVVKVQLASVQKDLSAAQASIKTLQGSIIDQNKAIDAWKAAGTIQAAHVATATAKGAAVSASYASQAQAALVQPAPADPCKDMDWLASEIVKAIPQGVK
jgi:hypothetical protein